MPSPAKLLASASGASVDPNFRNVTLLLHGDGSNGAQNNTFVDSSTNNFTITRNGNTTQGSFSPYGSRWSNYFNGSNYLSIANNAAFQFGTGDFTIECWVNKPAAANGSIVDVRSGGTGAVPWAFYVDGSNFPYFYDGTVYTSSVAITNNAWNHIAVVRTSGVLKIFVNGVQGYSAAHTVSLNATGSFLIGGTSAYTTGYISDLRVVKGTAVYTAAFTPPIAPLTAITNTSLLTCQSNRFRDASTNNFAITRNGDVQVTPFSPYAPTAPYSAAMNGGSMYFDGTGDYLTAPNNAAFNLGSSDFTLECWVYNNEVTDNCGYAGMWGGGYILYREATTYRFYYGGPSGSPLTSSIAAIKGAWTHLAVVRNGTTLTFYVNGVSGGSTSVSTTAISFPAYPFTLGANYDSGAVAYYFNGYIAGLRLVKGTAVYTAAFTPPTAPVTAITNTSLLLNGTNAAIIDSSADVDLETVGNAQISTSVKKFGTGSMAFDGSGDGLFFALNTPITTGDFTAECWFYTGSATNQSLFSLQTNSSGFAAARVDFEGSSSKLYVLVSTSGSSWAITPGTTTTVAANTWTHVALVRSGSTFTLYINGTSAATGTVSGSLFAGTLNYVGCTGGLAQSVNGYIDDLRITNGVARYTANFTPPTAAFPDQ